MKKIIVIIGIVISIVLLTGCTDNTLDEIQEKNELQNKSKSLVDPSEDLGTETDDDEEY
ncbi:hypothetical protein [Tenacibaculum sp. 190524A02b]|uniref:hypothetical protein n=1 Tax=Tenacibaculum vairaonense TaxID=3137860 RepID=UPI0031FAF870